MPADPGPQLFGAVELQGDHFANSKAVVDAQPNASSGMIEKDGLTFDAVGIDEFHRAAKIKPRRVPSFAAIGHDTRFSKQT